MTACRALVAAGAVAIALAYASLMLKRETVDFLVQEDGPFETAGAAGMLLAAVMFAITAWRTVRTPGARWLRPVVLIALALFFFVAAGEEISWGQRILGFQTPELIANHNIQDETNLHNLGPLQGRADVMFQLFWMLGFIAVPVLAVLSSRVRGVAKRFWPVAPLGIAVLLALTYLVAQVAERIPEWTTYTSTYPILHSVTEVKEALAGVVLGVAGVIAASDAVQRSEAPNRR